MRALALVVAALALTAGCGGPAHAPLIPGGGSASAGVAAPTHLAVSGPATAAKGATFKVEVSAALELSDLYGGGFELRYDPTLVEYVSADTTASKLTAAIDAVALRGGKQGSVVFGRTREGAAAGESVRGTFAAFTFKALKDGRATITLAAPVLTAASGAEISTSAPKGVDVTITP
jgi:hypothetical protein